MNIFCAAIALKKLGCQAVKGRPLDGPHWIPTVSSCPSYLLRPTPSTHPVSNTSLSVSSWNVLRPYYDTEKWPQPNYRGSWPGSNDRIWGDIIPSLCLWPLTEQPLAFPPIRKMVNHTRVVGGAPICSLVPSRNHRRTPLTSQHDRCQHGHAPFTVPSKLQVVNRLCSCYLVIS